MKAGFQNHESIHFNDPIVVRTWVFWTKTTFAFSNEDPVCFYACEDGRWIRMMSKRGRTDFASTPPFIWMIPSFDPERFVIEACHHDDFYKTKKCLVSVDDGLTWNEHDISKSESDALLSEMIKNGVNKGRWPSRLLYFIGVTIGGSFSWRRNG